MSDLLPIERSATTTDGRADANVAVDELMKLFSAVKGLEPSVSGAVLPVLTLVEDTLKRSASAAAPRELNIEFDERNPNQVKAYTVNNMTWTRDSDGRWVNDHKVSMKADVTADSNGNLKIERKNEDGSSVTQEVKPNGEMKTVARDKANHVWYELVQDSVGKTLSFKSENGVMVQNGGGVEPKLLSTMKLDKSGNLVLRRVDETDVTLKPSGEQKVSVRGTEYDEKTRYSVTVFPRGRDSQLIEIKDPNDTVTTVKQDKNGNLLSARIRATANDDSSGAWIEKTKDGLTYTNGRDSIQLKSATLELSGTIVMLDKSGTKKICLHPDGSTAEHSLINAEKGLWKPTSMKFGNGGTAEYKWDNDGTLRHTVMQSALTGGRVIEFERSLAGTFRVYESVNGKPSYLCCTIGVGVSAGQGISFSAGVGESLPHQDTLRGLAINDRGEPTLLFLPQTVETLALATASRASLSSSGAAEYYRSDLTTKRWIFADRKGEFISTKGEYFTSLAQSMETQMKVFDESMCQVGNEASKGVRKAVDQGIKDFDKLVCAGVMLDPGLKLVASSPLAAPIKKATDDLKAEARKVTEKATPALPEIEVPQPVAPRPLSPQLRLIREQDVSTFLKDHLENNTPGNLPNGTGIAETDTPRGKMTLQFEQGKVMTASLRRADGSVAQLRRTALGEVQEEFNSNGKLERATAPEGKSYKQVLMSEAANTKLPVERRLQSARLLIEEPSAAASATEKTACLDAIAETIKQASPKDQFALAKFLINADKQSKAEDIAKSAETGLLVMQELAFGPNAQREARQAIDDLTPAQKVKLMNVSLNNLKREIQTVEENKAKLMGSKFAQDPVYKEYAKSLGQDNKSFDHPALKPNLKQCEKNMDALVQLYQSSKDDPAVQMAVIEAFRTAKTIEGMQESNPSMKSLTASVGEIANQKLAKDWPADQQKRAVVTALLNAPLDDASRLQTAIQVLDTVEKTDQLWPVAAMALSQLQYSQADSKVKAIAKVRMDLLAKK